MVKVVRTINGNTIVVKQGAAEATVRLYGIVTPDLADKNPDVSRFGGYAKDFLSTILPENEWIQLEYEGTTHTDASGMTVAHVYRSRDGLFVNEKVVVEGYGVAYTKNAFSTAATLRAAEEKAKGYRKGLWGDRPELAALNAQKSQAAYLGESYSRASSSWVTVWIVSWW